MADYIQLLVKSLTWRYWVVLTGIALTVTAVLGDDIVWWNKALIVVLVLHLTYAFGGMTARPVLVRNGSEGDDDADDTPPDSEFVISEIGGAQHYPVCLTSSPRVGELIQVFSYFPSEIRRYEVVQLLHKVDKLDTAHSPVERTKRDHLVTVIVKPSQSMVFDQQAMSHGHGR